MSISQFIKMKPEYYFNIKYVSLFGAIYIYFHPGLSLVPSGQNPADSAGNPCGWWILGGGESPEKFGL